jgi:peptide/nickel transport system substrate-binding protein
LRECYERKIKKIKGGTHMHLKSKIKKIVLSVLIVILITLMAGGNAGVKGIFKFPDTVGHRFELEITKLSNKGIIAGYPDGTFRPDAMVKRSEIATLLVKVKNLKLYKPSISTFKDVATNNWAYGYIMAIQKDGLMVGYPDGTFKPDANVTRAELAVVLGRLKGLENEASKITHPTITAYDINKVPSWSMPYVDLGFQPQYNFLTGRAGYIAPQENATRGEVAYGLYVATNPPKFGGTLKVAVLTNPVTLDTQITTATIPSTFGMHIFETLFTYDENGEPIPLLVDSYNVSNDAKTYTFKLRKGIKFHNGKEMTADDVVASISRWGRLSTNGKGLFSEVESWTALDNYTTQMILKNPINVPAYLASDLMVASIYPKEVIDKVGDTPLKFTPEEIIGTGPYKFIEFVSDVHIKLIRFEDYSPRNDIPNGLGGRRTVYPDVLLINIVPDSTVRALGVITNLYDFAEDISSDQYGKLRIDPNIMTSTVLKAWDSSIFNKKQGVFTSQKMRQAFLAALDMEACMKGAFGNPDFWDLGPHLMGKSTPYYTDAGKEWYNQKNIERAKSLLAEAGYKGEPIRWLVSSDYPDRYNIALIAKDQLEKAGFVIVLKVVDWPTLLKTRNDPTLWDIFDTDFRYFSDPVFILAIGPSYPGWYVSPTMAQYLSQMRSETDIETRKIIWEKAQTLFWEDVPAIKYGDSMILYIFRTTLEGYRKYSISYYFFFNMWKES